MVLHSVIAVSYTHLDVYKRQIYQYVMLAPFGEDPKKPDLSLWNKRLVYHFQGGVGFGHYQGGPDTRAGLAYVIRCV